MRQVRLRLVPGSKSSVARGASSTVVLRGWNAGHFAATVVGRSTLALAVGATLAFAAAVPRSAAAQQKPPAAQRSTKLQPPADSVICDTTPVKLVRRTPVKPKVAAGRRKVVRPKPVVAKPVVKKAKPAVARAAGRRVRPKPAAPRKPNCIRPAAVVVAPTPEATKALVAALPWTAPAPTPMPELSPFSLPGTIGSRSNAWALGLAGLSAFYFVGHDHSEAQETIIPPPPPTVTPEPATFALLGTGLAALGGIAGLKRRRSSRND